MFKTIKISSNEYVWSVSAYDSILGLFLGAMDWHTIVYLEDGDQDGKALEKVIWSVMKGTGEGTLWRTEQLDPNTCRFIMLLKWKMCLQWIKLGQRERAAQDRPLSVYFKETLLGWVRLLPQGMNSPSSLMERFEPRLGSSSSRDSREKIPS